tara:strand:+ start:5532 stop:7235 length:1704 start_codon:yes stop_codon:yes gene_type:complete
MKKDRLIILIALVATISNSLIAQTTTYSISEILIEHGKKTLTADEAYLKMQSVYLDGTIHKCATPLHIFEYKYRAEISNSLLQRERSNKNKSALATYTSASGKFELTYQTTGDDAVPAGDSNSNGVPDYVEWAAEAADSSYNYLVNILGYTDPIPDGATYDISFEDMGSYGYVEPNGVAEAGTVMGIENDFVGFPANDDPDGDQRGALRATIAHEFKHAIQFAQNNFNGDSHRWAEMDATLAEEVVYDVVNDYYNYLGSGDIFGNPGVTVIPGSYEDVTWALYFHEKYGADFWPATWQRIENSFSDLALLDAIDQELNNRGDDYTETLQELYTWHFASGAYRNVNFGFEESLFYPTPNTQSNITQVNDQFSSTITLGRFAAYLANVVPPESQTGDASVLLEADSAGLSLAVVALFDDGSVSFELADEESGFLVVNEGWKWDEIERLGVVVLNERQNASGQFRIRVSDTFPTTIPVDNTKPTTTELKQNYPNPFNPSTTIPVTIAEFQRVKIDIYDITGRLVQSVFDGNLANGNYAIPVNLQRYASGVYMYRLQTSDQVQIKRMTLVK